MALSNRTNEVPLESIADKPISGQSIASMLNRFDALLTANPNRVVPYSYSDFISEYLTPDSLSEDSTQVAGKRWTAEFLRDGVASAVELTLLNEAAQQALIDAEVKTRRLTATVRFTEKITGTADDDATSFGLFMSIYGKGPAKHLLAGSEITGDLSLGENTTYRQEEALLQGAEIIGVETIIDHFMRETRGLTREFRIETPQMVGTDMVKAVGKLATLPELSQ